jgi:predicted transcriptional regulator
MSPIFYKNYLNFMKHAFTNALYSKSLTMQTQEQGDSWVLFLLDLILELLAEKNDWCNIEEIAGKAKLSESEATTLLDFLAEYSFAIVDTNSRKARINPRTHKFLKEIGQVDMEECT